MTAVSCSSSRNASTDKLQKTVELSKTVEQSKTVDKSESTQWVNVQMPVKLSLEQPRNFGVSGRATMVRGQLVYLSLRFFGMELATVRVTPDSVVVADRIHKYLFAESTAKVTAKTGYDINDIQDIILGMDKSLDNPLQIENGSGNKVATVEFSQYVDTPVGKMAALITAEGVIKEVNVKGSLEWTPKRAQWNDASLVPPAANNYKGYQRFGMAEVTELLAGFGQM